MESAKSRSTGFSVRNLLHFWFRLVGAAVRIKNDVDDGMIENQVV